MIDDADGPAAASATIAEETGPSNPASRRSAVPKFEGEFGDIVGERFRCAVELLRSAVAVAGPVPIDHGLEQLLEKRGVERLHPLRQPLQIGAVPALLKKVPQLLRGERNVVTGDSGAKAEGTNCIDDPVTNRAIFLCHVDLVPRTLRLLAPAFGHEVPKEAHERAGLELSNAFCGMPSTPVWPALRPDRSCRRNPDDATWRSFPPRSSRHPRGTAPANNRLRFHQSERHAASRVAKLAIDVMIRRHE